MAPFFRLATRVDEGSKSYRGDPAEKSTCIHAGDTPSFAPPQTEYMLVQGS